MSNQIKASGGNLNLVTNPTKNKQIHQCLNILNEKYSVCTNLRDIYNRKKQSSGNKRAIPIELIDDEKTSVATTYDVSRYTQLLAETCNSVTEPFGHTITCNNNNMTKLQCYKK